MDEKLDVRIESNGVAVITIDAPPANRLGTAIREKLLSELRELNADLSIRAIVLTGAGTGFCAGDNLREAVERGDTAIDSLAQFGAVVEEIERGRVPVIGAINGHAVGGGFELALACDIRLGCPQTSFIAAGVNVGLMASVWRLPRLIGIARAKAILLTGLPVDAQKALDYGIITEIHATDALLDAAIALAQRIASRAPLSVEAAKRQSIAAFDLSPQEALDAALSEAGVLCTSQDHFAAVDAFVKRETPTFVRA